jgi:hypothetical protein
MVLALQGACEGQGRGFSLPPGNVEAGKATFVELGCSDCHSVAGHDGLPSGDGAIQFALGGRVTRIKSYGDLVTSVINPSHKLASGDPALRDADGNSLMRRYNDVMTVQQLVDLVTFLQGTYEVYVPQTQFPTYP